MLSKTLRAFERNLGEDISERELSCHEITQLINVACAYTLSNQDVLRVSAFCTMIDDICEALTVGYFNNPSSGKRKREILPKLAAGYDISWIDSGLINAFHNLTFIRMFMNSLAEHVHKYPVTHATLFGDAEVVTDDSISVALQHLPKGYAEILDRVQNHIWKDTALYLFSFAVEQELGGPGTSSRLAIDLIESQLYSSSADAEHRYCEAVTVDTNTSLRPLGEILGNEVIAMLGPYPVNIAYGPLLQHAMFTQIKNEKYDMFDAFIAACGDNENGMKSSFVRSMGLHTFIGSFMLNTTLPKRPERANNLLCRSQLDNEIIGNILPKEKLRRLFDCFCHLDTFDDFAILSFSSGCHLLKEHKFDIVSQSCIEKLLSQLQSDEDNLKDLLEDKCYYQLKEICVQLLGRT